MAKLPMQVKKRLTIKDIVGGLREPKLDDAGNVVMKDGKAQDKAFDLFQTRDIALIVGTARSSEVGTTTYGDYTQYEGVFEATRLADGQTISAGRVIFPPPTDDVVNNIFHNAKSQDANAEVSFAFIIGTEAYKRGDEDKYKYTCKPLTLAGMETIDPLASIKAALGDQIVAFLPGAQKALEAPAPAPDAPKEGDKPKAK